MATRQKDGRYRAAVTVGGTKIWVSAHSKKQLQEKKAQVRVEYEYGITSKDQSFSDLMSEWFDDMKLPTYKKEATMYNARWMFNKYIRHAIDRRRMCRSIRSSDIQKIMTNAANAGASQHIQGMIRTILKQFCGYCVRNRMMIADYSQDIRIIPVDPMKQKRYTKPKYVTKEQLMDILERSKGTILQLPVALMAYAGLRRGQVFGLKWSDVDLKSHCIHVCRQIWLNTGKQTTTKSSAGVRTIQIPQQLVSILSERRGLPAAYVCQTMKSANFYNYWKRIVGNEINPHALRHTWVTMLYEAGVDMVTASRMAGHSSISVTADIYTEMTQKMKDEAKAKIDSAFAVCQKFAAQK